MSTYRITVIMPSLNEETNVGDAVRNVVEAFESFGICGEIIVVNDGSTDDTGKVASDLSARYPFLTVLRHGEPQGIGSSFWDGVMNARGEIVTMIPGDGENDASEILRYLPLLDHVDIVVPYVFNSDVRSFGRRALSALYRGIINASFGLSLRYMNGTVMYRRCVLRGISCRSRGFFYQTELLTKSIRRGYLYAEVPYALGKRAGGASKALTLSSLLKVTSNYLAVITDIYLKGEGDGCVISPESVTSTRRKLKESDKASRPVTDG
jgi:glycosyltransferase involved in cell wall biosynthesis